MKIRIVGSTALALVTCLSFATRARADATTSPGVNSVFVSKIGLILPGDDHSASLVTGMINKGKKKTVVAVEAMLSNIGQTSGPRGDSIFPQINGVGLEPTFSAIVNCPTITPTSFGCTLTGSWWLDIDAAEAAHPGEFIGKPLTITLMGAELTGLGDNGLVATLTARVQKK